LFNQNQNVMKFCPKCGFELKDEAKFCPSCGFQIVSQPQAPPPPEPAPQPAFQPKEATHAFTEAISGNSNLFQRVINILTKPKEEWQAINTEQPNTMKLIFGYALVLALIPTIASFVATGVIGTRAFGYTYRSFSGGIMQGLIQFFTALIGVYLLAIIIDLLAPSFNSEKNFGKSLQLAVYSYTAQWVAGIFFLIPGLRWLPMLAGLYSIYLVATGLPIIKKTPQDKVVGYVVVTILISIAIGVVLALILGAIFALFFVGSSLRGYGM
jgi:hypothetical protein